MNPIVPPPSSSEEEARQEDYEIRAPKGGLKSQVDAFEAGSLFLNLVITAGRAQRRITVHVYPDRDTFRRDGERPKLYHIAGGDCVETIDGLELDTVRRCSGHLTIEVTEEHVVAGRLGVLFTNNEGWQQDAQ